MENSMPTWTSGYVSEIAYSHGYYRELVPAALDFACLAAGAYAPHLQNNINFCELGC